MKTSCYGCYAEVSIIISIFLITAAFHFLHIFINFVDLRDICIQLSSIFVGSVAFFLDLNQYKIARIQFILFSLFLYSSSNI